MITHRSLASQGRLRVDHSGGTCCTGPGHLRVARPLNYFRMGKSWLRRSAVRFPCGAGRRFSGISTGHGVRCQSRCLELRSPVLDEGGASSRAQLDLALIETPPHLRAEIYKFKICMARLGMEEPAAPIVGAAGRFMLSEVRSASTASTGPRSWTCTCTSAW